MILFSVKSCAYSLHARAYIWNYVDPLINWNCLCHHHQAVRLSWWESVNYPIPSLQSGNKQQPAVKQGGRKNKGTQWESYRFFYYRIDNEKLRPLLLTLPFNAIQGEAEAEKFSFHPLELSGSFYQHKGLQEARSVGVDAWKEIKITWEVVFLITTPLLSSTGYSQ